MPRGERPLEAEGGPLLDFAARLRKLREKAGSPTYRDLARRAHYSIAALSAAAAGRQLPTLAVTLAYVRACGGDVREWERIWRATAAECAAGTVRGVESAGTVRGVEDAGTASAPYAGLASFRQSDADTFFGRERLTDRLVEHLKRKRFLVLFGASGSGKSSVLRAGVLPRFPGTPALILTPGAHPLEECAIQLAARARLTPGSVRAELASEPRALHRLVRQILAAAPDPEAELIIVVDQFEEVFTLCPDAGERDAFVAALLHAARTPDSRCRVALAVRSDFYTHCTRLPALVDALADAHLPVGPMTLDELRAAIVRPAARARLTVEGALLATLVADAHGRPGALPLLSHALLETWHRRRGNALTLAGFQAAGGFEGALAQTAEAFHTGLSDTQRTLTRRLFLRLVALGDGTEDTKRRVPRRELDGTDGTDGTGDTAFVLEQATRARLLTVDRDHVEITHEALIRCWPRLGRWLNEDRDRLRLHRALTEATAVWESLDRDPDTLYRGLRLAAAKELPDEVLTARERAFLDACETAERAEALRARHHIRRLRRLVAALVALLVCATTAVGFAVRSEQTVTAQRNHALALKAADASTALRTRDRSLAAQLALAAHRLDPGPVTRDALLSVAPRTLTRYVHALAVSPDGRTLATACDDGSLKLWNPTDPRRPAPLGESRRHPDSFYALAFGPGGETLAGVSRDGEIRLWDVSDPGRPRVLSTTPTRHTGIVFSLALSPDGRTLATGGYDHTVRLWNIADRARPRLLNSLTGHTLNVKPVLFSPDGTLLASGSDDRTVRLWDVTDPRDVSTVAVLEGHDNFVDALAHSRDGRTLLSGSDDHTALLWDVSEPHRPRRLGRLQGHTDVITSVEFAPGGRIAVTAALDGTARLWDTGDGSRPTGRATLTGLSGGLAAALPLAAHDAVVTLSNDHTIEIWPTDPTTARTRACAHVRTPLTPAQWARHFPGLPYDPPCAGPT
ncbi:WD40 repeat domain-containing protein [Streptomyces brasiliscabiei]|uniref:WD40 repeat domain-containing protein n=1 Tax=Streptomyces brasiliscabiei TaxID=2736302 RepID=UPI001C1275E3|nr:WD40 repeat domain-containing protein [Streptomyces brasiliscabiei]